MKSYKLVTLILILYLFISCTKNWLDQKPDIKLVVPSTLQDFQALMDNNGEINSTYPSLGEIASDGHFNTDAAVSSNPSVARNAYTWSHKESYLNVSDWNGSYGAIYYCDLVLDGIGKINLTNSTDLQTANDIKGQALFIRAKCFYELAQVYAPVYNSTSAKANLGIPLRLVADVNLRSTRSTLQETYDQILKDLTAAKDFLPILPVYKTRASKSAVFGMLARVYLSMGDYINAALNSDSCLHLYNTLIDYNTLNTSTSFPISLFNNEVIFHNTLFPYGLCTNNLRIDSNLYNLYTTNDIRKKAFFSFSTSDNTYRYKGYYSGGYKDFNGIATDEMYLIRAESLVRKGNFKGAIADLDTLLSNRYTAGTYLPITATDSLTILQLVLTERRKELLLRGLRWTDLRRLNTDPNFVVTIRRTYAGKNYTLTPNSYQYTFPIPDDIIQQSSLQQNIGW